MRASPLRNVALTSSLSDAPAPIGPPLRAHRRRFWVVAVAALVAIATSVWQLQRQRDGLSVSAARVGEIPVTVWRQAGDAPAPVVVIAHGFAGSQQLMQPFAITLARNGYIAVTFDFPGHGRNPLPLTGDLADAAAMQHDLVDTLEQVARFARPLGDGRLAVAGHSMAADAVVRFAAATPDVQATVAVSLFLPDLAPVYANNLLIVDGALEASMLRQQAFAIAAQTVAGALHADVTYGKFADGSARRVAFAPGVEHIGVLYSSAALRETVSWLDAAFDRHGDGFVAARGGWLGLLLLGCIALAWPLATLLPRIRYATGGRRLTTARLLGAVFLPALATPLLLCRLPTDFLPMLLGGYLTLHFGVYGLLTIASVWRVRRNAPAVQAPMDFTRVLAAAVAVIVVDLILIGLPLDSYVFSFVPGAWRYPLIAAVAVGTLPYFIADEWLTRHGTALPGIYPLTKLCFLLSLVVAIALNLDQLFFLVIIVPVIILLFVVFGLFSAWIFRRTGNAFVAAASNAVLFAWFIAVTFPLVSR